jgi:hypothetical protein
MRLRDGAPEGALSFSDFAAVETAAFAQVAASQQYLVLQMTLPFQRWPHY